MRTATIPLSVFSVHYFCFIYCNLLSNTNWRKENSVRLINCFMLMKHEDPCNYNSYRRRNEEENQLLMIAKYLNYYVSGVKKEN